MVRRAPRGSITRAGRGGRAGIDRHRLCRGAQSADQPGRQGTQPHPEVVGRPAARRRRVHPGRRPGAALAARRWTFDLHLMIFGDSTATGYGCRSAEEVPGVLIARGLAEQTGKRVRLSTKAIVGATSKGLSGQVDAMFVAGPPPDAAVILIGANDVTKLNGIGASSRAAGRGGAPAEGQRRGGRRRHLPRFRCRQGDPAAAALDGAHAWDCGWPARSPAPSGPPAVCRCRWPRWSTTSSGMRRADVVRRPVPSVGGRLRAGGQASCCPRSVMRSATGPASRPVLAGVDAHRSRPRLLGAAAALAAVAATHDRGARTDRRSCPRLTRLAFAREARFAPDHTAWMELSCRKPSSSQLPVRRSGAP